jgi:hypothetical protein
MLAGMLSAATPAVPIWEIGVSTTTKYWFPTCPRLAASLTRRLMRSLADVVRRSVVERSRRMVETTEDASATLAWVLPARMPRLDWSIRNQPVATRITTAAARVLNTTRNGRDLAHNRNGAKRAQPFIRPAWIPRPDSRRRARSR